MIVYEDLDCEKEQFNILVVDDSKVFNATISDGLKISGHNVTQAYTLKEASDLIEKYIYDFIILDLILPDGEGDQLLDELSAKVRSRVIVLSGDTDTQRRNYIFESGILDYFSKNNPTHLILDEIKKLLCYIEQNRKINILMVDDSSFIRKMLKGILAPKRYNIFEAISAEEGLDILSSEDIHLLLLDYEMPGMDGAALLEKIKSDIKYLELPVIMLSGNDDKDFIARVLKHGASDFIKKPFVSEELLLKCDLQVKQYINVTRIKQKEVELKKALERSKKAEQYKAMFLANMSHEIRTPLTAIMGFVDLLLDEEIDSKKLKYLNTIHKSGDHLLNLINDILDFTKIENNKLDINKEVFLLEELFNLIVTIYKPMIEDKGIEFKYSIDITTPKYFKSDFLRIKQILTNLIGNAIKFTSKNGTISFDIISYKDKFIEFSVKDSGIGIDSQNHDKVFKIFSQAEADTTKKFGGTGLGLSICSKLVELLNGEIELESELGEGSRFYFRLPIIELNEKEVVYHTPGNIKKAEEKNSIEFDNHILLVEDNRTNQMFMSVLLKKLGLTIDVANDGNEAVEMYKKGDYDLILMDENMPNMNGSEATGIIRKVQKEGNRPFTPIVALTANAIKGDRERFLDAGMDEYLSKPIDKVKLIEILTRFLKQDVVYDILEKKEENTLPSEFITAVVPLIDMVQKGIAEENFENIIKFTNLIKLASMKFKLQDIFALCLSIEQSIKEKDLQSARSYIFLIKGMVG